VDVRSRWDSQCDEALPRVRDDPTVDAELRAGSVHDQKLRCSGASVDLQRPIRANARDRTRERVGCGRVEDDEAADVAVPALEIRSVERIRVGEDDVTGGTES